MVFDDVKNDAYLEAMRAVITPESIVLDLGAGLGLFGLLAAKMGAKRVFLVEPEQVATVAEKLVKENGLESKVEVFRGRIEQVDLPEKVDIVVSVLTGNFLLSEDLLPSLFYARDKYLKGGGVMVPDSAFMMAGLLTMPRFHQTQVGIWSEPYRGLSWSSCRGIAANTVYRNRDFFQEHELISPPVEIHEMDFSTENSTDLTVKRVLSVEKEGTAHAIAGWFRMSLGERWLSTGPDDLPTHWTPLLLPLDPPLSCSVGDEVSISLRRPPGGFWTWTVVTKDGRQVHSEFLSQSVLKNLVRSERTRSSAKLGPDGPTL